MGNFNEHVYEGQICKRLAKDNLNMTEQCLTTTGLQIPPTHNSGSRPVMALYATSGADCINAAILPRGYAVGDHLVFIMDFTSESLLGSVFPRVVPAKQRKLQCNSARIHMNYTDKLNDLTNRHQMFKKLNKLTLNAKQLPQADFLLLLNRWDDKLMEHMRCSEEKCHSYKQDHIEWSLTVGVWLTRRWLLWCFLQFKQGTIKDPQNLIRDAYKKLNIGDPRKVTNP